MKLDDAIAKAGYVVRCLRVMQKRYKFGKDRGYSPKLVAEAVKRAVDVHSALVAERARLKVFSVRRRKPKEQ